MRWRTVAVAVVISALAASLSPGGGIAAKSAPAVGARSVASDTSASTLAAVHAAMTGTARLQQLVAADMVDQRRAAVLTQLAAGRAREVTIAATGDLLPHRPVLDAARQGDGTFDFVPLLRGVRDPITAADLALCHLEVPLSRDRASLSTYPVFNGPSDLAAALTEIGYDGCSVASNHAFDRGENGVRSTLAVLDAADLRHAGTARTRNEAQGITTYQVKGTRIAHLSYTYGLNGFELPASRRWMVNLISGERILADARRARDRGAQIVLVSLHWGQEYVAKPTAQQRRLARHLLAAPEIDVLIGHHAHVVQPVEWVNDKVVVFGLGNLLSNQTAACCTAATQDGVVVEITLRVGRDGAFDATKVRYWPTIVLHPQRQVVLVHDALPGATDAEGQQLRASLRRTTAVIGDGAELADR